MYSTASESPAGIASRASLTGPRSGSRSRASRVRGCSTRCCGPPRPRGSRSTGSPRAAARCCCGPASCATWPRPGWTRAWRSACSSGPGSGTASAPTRDPPTAAPTAIRSAGCASCRTRWRMSCGRPSRGSAASWSRTWGCGALPAGIVWKVSASMSPSNPVTVRILEDLGASTVNIPADATLEELAEMRAAVSLPLDLYVESPDALGGVVRGNELGDLIRAGAPLYAKFGLRNAQAIYPSGHHLDDVARANAIEKVHRAAVALEWLERLSPGVVQSKPGAAGLGLPVR